MHARARRFLLGLAAAFVLALLPCRPVHANPCAYDLHAGRNVLSGAPQPEIAIAEEQIAAVLTLSMQSSGDKTLPPFVDVSDVAFTIDYTFENRGDARTVVLGFPIGRVRQDIVSGFKVLDVDRKIEIPNGRDTLQGKMSLKGADLAACELGYFFGPPDATPEGAPPPASIVEALPPGSLERGGQQLTLQKLPVSAQLDWFLWEQTFPAKAKTRLRVSYRVRSEGDVCSIAYILSTARHWGDGTIGKLTITATLKGKLPKSFKLPEQTTPTGAVYDAKKRTLKWELKGFAPTKDLELLLRQGC